MQKLTKWFVRQMSTAMVKLTTRVRLCIQFLYRVTKLTVSLKNLSRSAKTEVYGWILAYSVYRWCLPSSETKLFFQPLCGAEICPLCMCSKRSQFLRLIFLWSDFKSIRIVLPISKMVIVDYDWFSTFRSFLSTIMTVALITFCSDAPTHNAHHQCVIGEGEAGTTAKLIMYARCLRYLILDSTFAMRRELPTS